MTTWQWHRDNVPITIRWFKASTTTVIEFGGPTFDQARLPVIHLHGHPGDSPNDRDLLARATTPVLRAILATGHKVYMPWTGANWLTNNTIFPATSGGTGLESIDNILTAISATKCHLVGVSLGGGNALTWARLNPTKIGGVTAYAPLLDIMGVYDNHVDYVPSIQGVHGPNRAAVLSSVSTLHPVGATASLAAIADHCQIFAARDDSLLPFSTAQTVSTATGIQLRPSGPVGEAGGDHLFWVAGRYFDEIYDLKWLRDRE